jgi:hypothetical protein
MDFHPVSHGVTLSTVGFSVYYGSQGDVFAASSGFVHLYTLHFEEKEKRASVVASATVHKQGSVQRFKFVDRLEFFSLSGGYVKISPECLTVYLNF